MLYFFSAVNTKHGPFLKTKHHQRSSNTHVTCLKGEGMFSFCIEQQKSHILRFGYYTCPHRNVDAETIYCAALELHFLTQNPAQSKHQAPPTSQSLWGNTLTTAIMPCGRTTPHLGEAHADTGRTWKILTKSTGQVICM